ncbi:MAG: hypothetical protein COA58_05700 [Bacteroidetes bacterium]|nr:MAG: hypothetical protein COA58_05700 [Bacteroidota bacterium]
MTKTTKTIINTVVFLLIGATIFYFAVVNQDTDSIWEQIKSANPIWIIIAMVCGILSHLARALRWNILLQPMGYKATLAGSFHAVILGYLVNMAVPRAGEIARPAVLSKLENIPFNKLVGTVVVERVVDLLITLVIAVIIFIAQFDVIADFFNNLFSDINSTTAIIYLAVALFIIIIGFIVYKKRERIYQLPIVGKLKSFIEGLLDGVKTIFKLKQNGLFLFYSLFIWVMYFLMSYFIFFALEGTSHLGISAGLTVLLFGTAAMIIPIPGGLGTYEAMVPAGLALYGIGGILGKSFAILTHSLQIIVIFGVGIYSVLYFVIKSNRIKKNELGRTNPR